MVPGPHGIWPSSARTPQHPCEPFISKGTAPANGRKPSRCLIRSFTRSQAEDPLFHTLLLEFGKRTGYPVLLNTSFNAADEPIVCSPADAARTFLVTRLDALVIGSFVVERR